MTDFEKMRAASDERNAARALEMNRQRLAQEAAEAAAKAEYELSVDMMFARQQQIRELARQHACITKMLAQCADTLDDRANIKDAMSKEEVADCTRNFKVLEMLMAPVQQAVETNGVMQAVCEILDLQADEIASHQKQCECAEPASEQPADEIGPDHVARAA
jgi:FtsZ-binding cell division protein ZapB